MKTKIFVLALALAFAFLPAEAGPKKEHLPFAPKHKYGKLPVKRNKPVKNRTSWTYRQWNHQGN
jgi:hypothetical protein